MKHFFTLIFTLMGLPLGIMAQGWPANYDGVMLQGFYWDSYSDTQWTNLTSQADELSKYFNLIWVPQSGWCKSTTYMGYYPIYWFDQRSAFGSEDDLRTMISTFKKKDTGIIADAPLGNAPVKVFAITGSELRRCEAGTTIADAVKGLPKGLYIVGNRKIIVNQ